MMDRADYEEQLREPKTRTIMCPYCLGHNTLEISETSPVLYADNWICFDCQTSFNLVQSVMAEDDSIPF